MTTKPKVIYVETTCFVEMAKHAVGTGNPERADDIWYLKALLEASRKGEVKILTATLSIAECQHAEEPSSDGIPSDNTRLLFKNLLTSGQYLALVQDTVLVAERARNLRWVHGICMSGPDAIYAASALEVSCDEFLSFDRVFHKNKKELAAISINVCLPRNTTCLPAKYTEEEVSQDPQMGFDLGQSPESETK